MLELREKWWPPADETAVRRHSLNNVVDLKSKRFYNSMRKEKKILTGSMKEEKQERRLWTTDMRKKKSISPEIHHEVAFVGGSVCWRLEHLNLRPIETINLREKWSHEDVTFARLLQFVLHRAKHLQVIFLFYWVNWTISQVILANVINCWLSGTFINDKLTG